MDLIERADPDAQRHPWEVCRLEFFCDILKRNDLLDTASWLDVGSGDAWFATELLNILGATAAVTAWDAFYTPEDLTERDAAQLKFVATQPDQRFERILLMDVVEHVEDDRGFLTDIVEKNLSDDGRVLITVPAYQQLFSNHDTYLRHYRRYSPSACRSLIADSGLEICQQGGLFHSLLIARAVGVAIEKLRKKTEQTGIGAWTQGPAVTTAVIGALRAESKISGAAARRGWTTPGLTYWAVCKRKSDSV